MILALCEILDLKLSCPLAPTEEVCVPWFPFQQCLSSCLLSPLKVCWSTSRTICIYTYVQLQL